MKDVTELVLVFLKSKDRFHWEPIERDQLPQWLRQEWIWDKLIAGECVRSTWEDAERKCLMWFTATAVDRNDVKTDAVLMPPRLVVSPIIVPERLQ